MVVGLIVGYGVKELVPEPRDTNYSPTTTGNSQQVVPTTVPSTAPTTGASTPANQNGGTTPPAPTTTANQPPLRPDTGLPQIPFPADLPRILGPLLGTTLPSTPDPNTLEKQDNPGTTVPVLPRTNSGSGGAGVTTLVRPTD
ncbi:hypothetical protein [Nocardia crassostreae]|uniref:hypothetical protein n=1 Tax=Nocardia crassostreae TaxID=53428 RepID=UPI0008304B7F|nr:hypothetical protein [Nocardia crassostreae]